MASKSEHNPLSKVAVVIPAFKVADHILGVISSIPKDIKHILLVDDACPESTGKLVEKHFKNKVKVLYHATNQGVGGAMITGYKAALSETTAEFIVKIDGDGQMDPAQISRLIYPIIIQRADYTKGNRFNSIEDLELMPRFRLVANAILSLFAKFSTGYWNITDPTNGFTCVHRAVLENINLDKLRKTYFFENDFLFRLSLLRAVVEDVPMRAIYGTEVSNIRVLNIFREFPFRFAVNYTKRIIYQYYLREWSAASIELPLGLGLFMTGCVLGVVNWQASAQSGIPASPGSVMIPALLLIFGFQLLLAFLNFDISSTPRAARHKTLGQ